MVGVVLVAVAVTAVDGVATQGKSWAADASATLFSEGGSFDLPLVNTLQNSAEGVAAVSPLQPGFFNANIDQARDDFASGAADYAVSELPLTTAQVATAQQNHRSFAYVPFAAGPLAIGAVMERSNDNVLKPDTLVPNVQLSVALVASALTNAVSSWNDPKFSQASGGKQILTDDESANIHPVNAVDPSAVNIVLQSLFVNDPTNGNAAKQIWDSFISKQNKTDDTPSEHWPTGGGLTGGDRAVADALIPVNETTLVPNTNPSQWGNGDIAALPVDWLGPPRNIPTVAIQNVAGAYVSPTIAGMTAALQDATMDPTTNLITYHANPANAAAYPIPTISYLIVPTSGLSVPKATALAAFIRYVLGPQGQSVVQSFGAASVTQAMVTAGLHVADSVAAEGSSTPTTTTTTAAKATPTTTTTTAVRPATGSTGSSSGAVGTLASDTGPTLASTGGPPWSLPVLGGATLVVGVMARRILRRRIRTRASAP